MTRPCRARARASHGMPSARGPAAGDRRGTAARRPAQGAAWTPPRGGWQGLDSPSATCTWTRGAVTVVAAWSRGEAGPGGRALWGGVRGDPARGAPLT